MLHIPFELAVSGDEPDKTIPCCLVELSVNDTHYLSQIAGHDRVHSFGAQTVDDLCKYRVGGRAKAAFAIVSHAEDKVEAVIFGHRSNKPIKNGKDLQGNVAKILHEKTSKRFDGQTTAMVFYTISAITDTKGTGQALIDKLLETDHGFLPATLSPLRTLSDAYPGISQRQFARMAREEKQMLAFLHLLNFKDVVQGFHMGRGAIIRDIKLDANLANSQDGILGRRVMVNYGYIGGDLSVLAENKSILRSIKASGQKQDIIRLVERPLAKHLTRLVASGVMKQYYPAGFADNIKRAAETYGVFSAA